jgi:glycosyltransferase involved in cell wall biosynthesis
VLTAGRKQWVCLPWSPAQRAVQNLSWTHDRLNSDVLSLNSPASDAVQVPVSAQNRETDPTVTVVICSRNRPAFLGKCLEAVAALTPAPDDVLVVDNSEGDKETESIARKFSARYIVEANLGLSRARNRGMAESTTDIVAYLDDDATPDRSWLENILAPFADPRVAVVTGETVLPNSVNDYLKLEPMRTLSKEDPLWFEAATFGGLGVGNNMALRKTACPDASAFDVRLGRGAPIRIAEESHAFASLLSKGFRAVHVPNAIVVHPVTNGDIEEKAADSVAYWLLLFSEFPGHRMDLLRFLFKRLRRKPLTWPRNPQIAGEIITSGLGVYLRGGIRGWLTFLRARKLSQK